MRKSLKTAFRVSSAAAATWLALSAVSQGRPEARTETALNIRHHDVAVRILPEEHRLEASDRLTFEAAERDVSYFYLGEVFEVTRARLDGRRVELERVQIDYPEASTGEVGPHGVALAHPDNRVMYRLPAVKAGEHTLEVDYAGVVYDTLRVPEGSRSGIPSESNGLVDTSGTYLGGWRTGWYPDGRDNYARFSIRVTTPPAYRAVTEGKRVATSRRADRRSVEWEVAYPTRHVTLIAAKYLVRERAADGVTLMAYFFPSEVELIDTYLEASERYIRLYNKLIGPYPFTKFAVVENFFPTGYGMPSYTLLGRRIVRLPFIVETSLGHEVVHNWWGNCVYPDDAAGNWCEGLATFYADYRYESEKGDSLAVAYRRDILLDYATHVTDSTNLALADFQSREDDVTSAIGYGKCTMVFHMLRDLVGEDKFYRAMRHFFREHRFETADWEDIEWALEEVYGGTLDQFFRQWVGRPGAPRLTLSEVTLERHTDGGADYVVRVTLRNEGGYVLPRVPVEIVGPTATRRIAVAVTGESASFDWRLGERPIRLAVDPGYDIFRRLGPAEVPVTIARALAADDALVVLPAGAAPETARAFEALAQRLAAGEGTTAALDTTLAAADLAGRAVFVLGGTGENAAWRWLQAPPGVELSPGAIEVGGRAYTAPDHAAFVAFTNTVDSAQTACAIVGNSAEAVRAAGYKVIYYGKYSYVTFEGGEKQATGVFTPPPGPLVHAFGAPNPVRESR